MTAYDTFNLLLAGGPLGLVVRATLILLASGVASVVLWRASAATRHLVWLAALGACAALPMVAAIAPRIDVRSPVRAPARSAWGGVLRPMPVVRGAAAAWSAPRQELWTLREALRGAPTGPVPLRMAFWAKEQLVWRWSSLISVIWAAGALAVIGRCIVAHRAVARLVDRARDVESADWDAAVIGAADAVGSDRPVRVLASELAAPVTSGWRWPVILVPHTAGEWSTERRRVVLVHELAHVARHDYLAQLIATLACALFWFHPLAWLAASRLRTEAEQAADDCVLIAGVPGVTYATHLLELARAESGLHVSAVVAVGMVRASHLEGRFRAMLDMNRSRRATSGRRQFAAGAAALAAIVPLAGMRAVPRPRPPLMRIYSAAAPAEQSVAVAVATTATHSYSYEEIIKTASVEDSTIDKTVAAASGGHIAVDLETGGAVIVHGWDQPQVRVHARLAGRDWRETNVTLERENDRVRLRSAFSARMESQSTAHSFELWVPRHTDVELSSAGGGMTIENVTGTFRGHTGGGGITITGASGNVSLTTGGGDIHVAGSSLDGTVETGGGTVDIDGNNGNIHASSAGGGYGGGGGTAFRNGTAEVTRGTTATVSGGGYGVTSTNGASAISGSLGGVATGATSVAGGVGYGYAVSGPDGATIRAGAGSGVGGGVGGGTITTSTRTVITDSPGRGSTVRTVLDDQMMSFGPVGTTISKAGGDVDIQEAPRGARISTGGGSVRVASSSGPLEISTGAGAIEAPHVGGNISAWTGAGDVKITIVNTDGSEHSVDVFTGSGRVELELPRSLDARFELETAYTESASRTKIDSDIPLEMSETQSWDASQGTPRRYVRARGTVGNGAGLIRIRVVNGDIVVRRAR